MGFPDLAEHLEDRFGQRENTLLVSLADDAQDHLLRVDRGNGQRDRLGDAQAIGVDEGETAAIDGLFQCGDQAAAVRVTADVGQPLPAWPADFFSRMANLTGEAQESTNFYGKRSRLLAVCATK